MEFHGWIYSTVPVQISVSGQSWSVFWNAV